MQAPLSWREFLGGLIQNPQERQRIANELNVNPLTLTRWATDESKPRPHNLRQLLNVLPQHRNILFTLIAQEFPEIAADAKDEAITIQEIPSETYARVLATYLTTPKAQRFWSIGNLILQQALGQLDPNHLGMAIVVAQCMPPSHSKKIRSLRERMGRGTTPWPFNLDEQAVFLGAESLAGYAVSSCRPVIIQNTIERGGFQAQWAEWEQSAAAYSIMRLNASVGCLMASSTQAEYFLPSRQTLLENYAALMALAFEPEEFYGIQDIELRPMPSYGAQKAHMANFRQRLSSVILEAQRTKQSLSLLEAEQVAWQQVAEELLHLSSYTEGENASKELIQ